MWAYRVSALAFCVLVITVFCAEVTREPEKEEDDAVLFLKDYEKNAREECRKSNLANWAYNTNITDETQNNMVSVDVAFAAWQKEQWKKVRTYGWARFQREDVRRQFKQMSVLGTAALDGQDYAVFANLTAQMDSIYSKQKICSYSNRTKCDLSLDPDVTEIFANSRDPEELKFVWLEWHNKLGRSLKPLYPQYVEMSNKGALANNLKDAAELWLEPYDSQTIRADFEALWHDVKPLYQQLHAYVRRKLADKYGESVVNRQAPIPAHLLGNMWGQSWNNILDFIRPYPKKSAIDVTDEMKRQNYTIDKMFKLSEHFFVSLGLSPMTKTFWNESMIAKPTDRDVVCHASAWDFCDGEDFRVKMCTKITMEDLITVHHEMGHIEYFQQYADQPYSFRDGANEGFHEAIGDTIELSVSTPDHLKTIGLLDKDVHVDNETTINFLFNMATRKLAFLPFGYLIDLWRWEVFEGKTQPADYNRRWWEIRNDIQGLAPPEPRSNSEFDAGPKYHVAGDVPYIRYFVSHILQFQFQRSLCIKAGQFDPSNPNSKPLHACDIYNNKDAGKMFSDMLKLGSSRPWGEVLKMITGSEKMDAGPLLEYFSPLMKFFEEINKEERIGWS